MPEPTTNTKKTRTRRSSANSQTIQLRSGGSITLSGEGINPFSMSADDLAFVTELASRLRGYGASQAQVDPRKVPVQPPTPTREAYEHAVDRGPNGTRSGGIAPAKSS